MRQGSVRGTFSVLLCLVSIVLSLAGIWAQTTIATFPPSQLPTRGLWVQIEERGWPNGSWPWQVIQQFKDYDPSVGHTVSEEVALQLDVMWGMGANTIIIELRTADQDGNHTFPICHLNPVLGFQWPQPTATAVANLPLFFNLAQSEMMKVILVLVNTHMEELPRTNSETWLNAILNTVKNHPALDFVVFNGDAHIVDTDDSLRLLLQWPEIPYILRVPLIAENSLALWLLVFCVNEAKWRAQTEAFAGARAAANR